MIASLILVLLTAAAAAPAPPADVRTSSLLSPPRARRIAPTQHASADDRPPAERPASDAELRGGQGPAQLERSSLWASTYEARNWREAARQQVSWTDYS